MNEPFHDNGQYSVHTTEKFYVVTRNKDKAIISRYRKGCRDLAINFADWLKSEPQPSDQKQGS